MTYVSGGEKCALLSYFNPPGTFERSFGCHRWLAQTFNLPVSAYPDYLVLKYKAGSPQTPLIISVRTLDPLGAPTGPDLITLEIHPNSQSYKPYTVWAGFRVQPSPLLPPAQYALVARAPGAPDPQRYLWQSQETTDLYPGGKAWHSNDDGATWLELPTTDLCFEIWGRPESEPPPQPDVIGNWAVLTHSATDTLDGVLISCTTNIPCHLYCRTTPTVPQRHLIPTAQRGATVATYIDQCFVAYYDTEQAEQGDTLLHSFLIAPWPFCETRWYYFWGTKRRQPIPSASPIFQHHSLIPTLYCYNTPANIAFSSRSACAVIAFPFRPCASYTLTAWRTHLARSGLAPPQDTFEIFIFSADANSMPLSTIGYGSITGFNLPPFPAWLDVDFIITPTPLIAGANYAIGWRVSNNYHRDLPSNRISQDGRLLGNCEPPAPPARQWVTYPGFFPDGHCLDPSPLSVWNDHGVPAYQYFESYGIPTPTP